MIGILASIHRYLLLLVGVFDPALLTMGILGVDFPVFKKWAGRKTGIDNPWWILDSWRQSTFPRFILEVQTRVEWCWQSYQNVHYWHILVQFCSFGVWGKPRITPHNKAFTKTAAADRPRAGMPAPLASINNVYVCPTYSNGARSYSLTTWPVCGLICCSRAKEHGSLLSTPSNLSWLLLINGNSTIRFLVNSC